MNGIGGRTIEEAQNNMSYQEYYSWKMYRDLRGPMNPLLRLDRAAALISVRTSGGKMLDYMPWAKDPKPLREDSSDIIIVLDKEKILGSYKNVDVSDVNSPRKLVLKKKKELNLEDRKSRILKLKKGRE